MSNIQKLVEKRLEVMREGPPAIWDREEIAILEALRDMEKMLQKYEICVFEYTHRNIIGHQEWVPHTDERKRLLRRIEAKFEGLLK